MDGLLIAEQLALLTPRLPAARGAWRFPDDRTALLPLHDGTVVTLSMRPPDPSLAVSVNGRDDVRARETGGRGAGRPRTPFQAQLAARATGDLVAAKQHALDRVVSLRFGEGTGFVPEPPIELVVELTGRNANLILVNADGRIVGAQRVVPGELNRHREIRGGVQYVAPPPYDKVDPRGADGELLRSVLADRPLRDVRRTVDGIGARLYASLAALAGVEDETAPLTGTDLERAVASLLTVVAGPTASLHEVGERDADVGRLERRTESLRSSVAKRLAKRTQVASKRVADARLAVAAASDVAAIRAEADLLLANVGSYVPHGDSVELVDFDGAPVRLAIDPKLDAAANAAQRYARARRREARAARAQERLPDLLRSLRDLEEASDELATVDLGRLEAIERMLNELEPGSGERPGHAGAKPKPRLPGVRFVDPRGYEVLIGRSARENDAITFGVAKSRDLWLHVQGYQGSHVIVRSQGREVPFDTVVFAARLAAGYSRAKDSDNVPVDYTERKNVWRVKGGAPGAVHLAHQKTVYVTPARDDTSATSGGGTTKRGEATKRGGSSDDTSR